MKLSCVSVLDDDDDGWDVGLQQPNRIGPEESCTGWWWY